MRYTAIFPRLLLLTALLCWAGLAMAESGVVVMKNRICFAIQTGSRFMIVSGQIYPPIGAIVNGDFSATLFGPIKIFDSNGDSAVGFTWVKGWAYSKDDLPTQWKFHSCE